MTTAESLLDQKFKDSYQQLQKERKRSGIARQCEVVGLLLVLVAFLMLLKFIFWGAGFSQFAPEQHAFTTRFLVKQPGPQSVLVAEAMSGQGYISLLDYHKYVAMANEYKATHSH